MTRFIVKKTITATVIHLILLFVIALLKLTMTVSSTVIGYFWCVGIVYSASHYLSVFERHLNSMLKLSVISYLAFGKGTVGFLCVIMYLMYVLFFGWLYGLYLLFFDIIITKKLEDQQRREGELV